MKSKTVRNGLKSGLHFIQHVLLVIVVLSILIVSTGSVVVLHGLDGVVRYSLNTASQEKEYENSSLFYTLYSDSVADIVRLGTIRSQMETNGKYDPDKEIDVTAFNYRETTLPDKYLTAKYRLEDLLKWGKYGFEYVNTDFSMVESSDFFKNYEGDTIYTDDEGTHAILKNRYKTVDGKNVEDLVQNWQNYYLLCENIESAAKSLYSNYEEYLKLMEYYDGAKTNLKYYIMQPQLGSTKTKVNVYTNTELDLVDEEEIQTFFNGLGEGLYYSPSDMVYKTTTPVDEKEFRSILKGYEYAYPENMKIWIGVDTKYPVKDIFSQGASGYQNYMPYLNQLIAVAVLAGILYVILLVYLTLIEGQTGNKKEIALKKIDRISTEIALAFGIAVIGWIYFLLVHVATGNFSIALYDFLYDVWFKVVLCVITFLLDFLVLGVYYSFVRRIKAHTIWSNSIVRRICCMIGNLGWNIYDNGGILAKSVLPILLIGIVNLVLMLITFSKRSLFFVVIAACFDICIIILYYREVRDRKRIMDGIRQITDGDFAYQIDTANLHGDNKMLADAINEIGNSINDAVASNMKNERMKADLITNVSHDIKTPLTSIINYIDLIKREQINNPKIEGYIQVLDEKSQRLKQLTDDLVEASKISSGNVVLNMERINLKELLQQSIGEFSEKLEEKNLEVVVTNQVENPYINADSRRIWRVIENLFNNIYKYAMPHTRVYLDLFNQGMEKEMLTFVIKNISNIPLNCDPSELTERFIRGDESRTTEGSGLGLSIAKNLTELQKGHFEISLDGDLFKVQITFPIFDEKESGLIAVETEEK